MEIWKIRTLTTQDFLIRCDRGWTERAVYGKVRCMTSASTARKYKTKGYVDKYNKAGEQSKVLGSGPSFYSAHQ